MALARKTRTKTPKARAKAKTTREKVSNRREDRIAKNRAYRAVRTLVILAPRMAGVVRIPPEGTACVNPGGVSKVE